MIRPTLHPGLAAILAGALAGPPAAAAAAASGDLSGSTYQAAAGAVLPASMTGAGPYGSPLQLAPSPPGTAAPWTGPPIRSGYDLRADRDGALDTISRLQVPSSPKGSPVRQEEEDETIPVRPGTLANTPVRIPTYDWRLQAKPVASHLAPDVSIDVDGRTSIGLFSDGTKVDMKTGTGLGSVLGLRRDAIGATAQDTRVGNGVLPSIRARDLSAGVTLQYRFGQ